jgi:hypothetical protein
MTATKTWTRERKAEYKLRKWEPTEKVNVSLEEAI